MRKTIYTLAIMAAAMPAFAQSPAQKEVAAEDKVGAAKANLKEAKQELDATFPAFRKDARMQISVNEKKIAELRANHIRPIKSQANLDRKKNIDDLENRNVALRNRLYVDDEK